MYNPIFELHTVNETSNVTAHDMELRKAGQIKVSILKQVTEAEDEPEEDNQHPLITEEISNECSKRFSSNVGKTNQQVGIDEGTL